MRRAVIARLEIGLLGFWAACQFASSARAASLPTFEDFRRIDRARRLTGQFLTPELLEVTRIDPSVVLGAGQSPRADWQLRWAAAELLPVGPDRQAAFESALRTSGTNVAVALRFACATAYHGESETARQWLRYCEREEPDNLVPWLAELWMQQRSKPPGRATNLVARAGTVVSSTVFRDYRASATRARIRLLQSVGYSPYAARRLGVLFDSVELAMARDLAQTVLDPDAEPLALAIARALQRSAPFLVAERIGERLERAVLLAHPDARPSPEVRQRLDALDARQEEISALLADLEEHTVDLATESEMVQYFDDVLSQGEESAMKKLAATVRRSPAR